MSAVDNIKTILNIGATSGLDQAFARRFHSLGKKILIAGRAANLKSIEESLGSNVASYQWNIIEFSILASTAIRILTEHSDINAVLIVAGIGSRGVTFLNPSASIEDSIIAEVNTNITTQYLLSRIFIPHLASLASSGQPALYLLMGSGLGLHHGRCYGGEKNSQLRSQE